MAVVLSLAVAIFDPVRALLSVLRSAHTGSKFGSDSAKTLTKWTRPSSAVRTAPEFLDRCSTKQFIPAAALLLFGITHQVSHPPAAGHVT